MNRLTAVALSAVLGTTLATGAQAQDITIGAASVGGTYYVWAGGLANVLNNAGMNANVEVTGGPLHNVQLVDAGEMELGLVTAAPAYEGFHGEGWADGEKFSNIRALVPMFPSYFTWWSLADSGIESYADLEGKIVAMGPTGGTPDTYGRLLYEHTGLTPASIVNAGFSDIVNMLRDGQVEAAFTTAGLPHPAVAETESTHDINLITSPDDVSASFIEAFPYFGTNPVPAGTYRSVTEDQNTLTVWNFLITNADISDDLAYEIVSQVYEQHPVLMETHRASATVQPENVNQIVIPLHPGAVRYYQEHGFELAPRLIP